MIPNEVDMSLRARLRAETRGEHERVDAAFGSCDFGCPDGYRHFLMAQAVAWRTLEPVLKGGSAERAAALRTDLDALGLAPPAPLEDVDLPNAGSIGTRYVLEGSRLGSTVLLRDLQTRSPDMAGRASHYLAASSRLDEWRKLSTMLQKPSLHDASETIMIDDARRIFGLFERAWHAAAPAAARKDG